MGIDRLSIMNLLIVDCRYKSLEFVMGIDRDEY
jgi:hypothetical protein